MTTSVVLTTCILWMVCLYSVVHAADDMCNYQQPPDSPEGAVIPINSPPGKSQECQCLIEAVSGDFVIEYSLTRLGVLLSSCAPMLYIKPMTTVEHAYCAEDEASVTVFNTNKLSLSEGQDTTMYLFNLMGNNISGSIVVRPTGDYGNFSVNCNVSQMSFFLPHCPCPNTAPPTTVAPAVGGDAPLGKRFLVGFMAAFALLVLIGLIFLLRWYLKRRKGEKKSKTYEDVSPYATSTIAVPSMFVSDNPAFNLNDEMNRGQRDSAAGTGALAGSIPSYNTTPTSQRAMAVSGVYAEIGDVSGSSSQLPFTPDAGLQLGLQKPYNNRGSTDSGLYSTPSDNRHMRNFEGPYATSTETLDSHRGSTPTKSPSLSPAQVEALYAKPVKVKKPKKPRYVSNEPPELPPVRYDLGDISRTGDSSHNVSKDTIETDV